MYNFDKKQKIILGVLVAIVAGFICYYVYAKEGDENLSEENNLTVQEETQEKDEYSDDVILVHVSGAINQEGVVELKVDSRISDAIDKAGGVREDAYTEDINLAYKLEDGMKIHIPTKQEKQNSNSLEKETKDATQDYVTTSSGGSVNEGELEETKKDMPQGTKNSKVNINTATQAQLETLPGIGPSTATKILAYRKEKGKFTKIEDIKEVSGIGNAKFEKIKDSITVK